MSKLSKALIVSCLGLTFSQSHAASIGDSVRLVDAYSDATNAANKRVLRHSGSYIWDVSLNPRPTDLDINDSQFFLRQGLASEECYSFESVNYPGYFIRHEGFRLKISEDVEMYPTSREDATFCFDDYGKLAAFNYSDYKFGFEQENGLNAWKITNDPQLQRSIRLETSDILHTPFSNDGSENNKQGYNWYLDRHFVNCSNSDNGALQGFQLERDNSGKQIRYRFKCDSYKEVVNKEIKSTAINDDGDGNSIYLDRHNVDCGYNPVISFKLTRVGSDHIKYDYICGDKELLSSKPIYERHTSYGADGASDSNFGSSLYLDRHNVDCPDGNFISAFKLHVNGSHEYRYNYTCRPFIDSKSSEVNWQPSAGRSSSSSANPRLFFRVIERTNVEITLESDDVDTFLYLVDESGRVIRYNNDFHINPDDDNTNSRIALTLDPGSYAAVSATNGIAYGDGIISIESAFGTVTNIYGGNEVRNALHKAETIFAGESDNIRENKDDLFEFMTWRRPDIQPISFDLPYVKKHVEVSSCVNAIGVSVVRFALFASSLAGLPAKFSNDEINAVVYKLSQSSLPAGLQAAIIRYHNQVGAYDKAKAALNVLSQINNASLIYPIFQAYKGKMVFGDWIKAFVTLSLQLTAWIASDGTAFIAEAGFVIMSADALAESSADVYHYCRS
ncbi:conserved hypothetical protein [Hahella chejuensis KCTC 2396]|uniref:Alpha-L-arabinofuranosidase B arabinose-binding domain-containing protein n=1 Tax=Hahella chejuensis (strain KCTC 2396) TaxID=349521 RepID=Q2SAH2_HAHCH|nr:AbfB domain-containing protein [Hahella chejuensis]ABC32352.1 conserved hypothetical protein [Hahella chejuensis KCTC 2396]